MISKTLLRMSILHIMIWYCHSAFDSVIYQIHSSTVEAPVKQTFSINSISFICFHCCFSNDLYLYKISCLPLNVGRFFEKSSELFSDAPWYDDVLLHLELVLLLHPSLELLKMTAGTPFRRNLFQPFCLLVD